MNPNEMDMISTLTDDIIANKILSLLSTQDSVRTSILSTKWKQLYAYVPVIDFEDIPGFTTVQFTAVVTNVLNTVTHNLPSISTFRISSRHTCDDIVSWIETAVSHSVQKIDVSLGKREGWETPSIHTPHGMFTCTSLVSLTLNHFFVLDVPDKVNLPRLKEMYFYKFVVKDDNSVPRLLSGCPVLETLVVNGNIVNVINVSVPSLKTLNLEILNAEVELVINRPNLEKLGCTLHGVRGYSGDVLESLTECYLDIEWLREEGKLMEFVKRIYKVRSLALYGESMKALLTPSGSLPLFENLTTLKLESSDYDGWESLPYILERSPRLEEIGFVQGFFQIDYYYGNPFPLPEHVPVCVSSHLKRINIDKFAGDEDEYRWVEYFLKNALVLEKMVICPWLDEGLEDESESEGKLDMERLSQINKTLSTFRQFRETCQLVIDPHSHNVLEI